MSDLHTTATLGWFKREVAVPGAFARLFPETTDDLVAASLVDGLYRAKLDGFFPDVEADPTSFQTTPDLSMTGVALVVIYAGIKFLQNEIKNMATRSTYRAPGGLEATTERSPNVLAERLKELDAERKALVLQARGASGTRVPTAIHMRDGYAVRISALTPVEWRRGPLALTV